MRLYLEIARSGWRRTAAYPAATLAGVFTNTIFGFLRAYVLLALFDHGSEFGGYDAQATVTYVWLTQAMIAMVWIWGWHEFARRIREGDVATDLVRPVHPQAVGLASDLGRGAFHALFRGIPPVLIGSYFFDLITPGTLLVWGVFLASCVLAVAVSFAFRFLYNLTPFWLLYYRGMVVMMMILANLFSGFVIPVNFFPRWLEVIANLTPFPSMVQIPIDIFVGRTQGIELLAALGVQLFWVGALLALGRLVFARGVRRLVIQGG